MKRVNIVNLTRQRRVKSFSPLIANAARQQGSTADFNSRFKAGGARATATSSGSGWAPSLPVEESNACFGLCRRGAWQLVGRQAWAARSPRDFGPPLAAAAGALPPAASSHEPHWLHLYAPLLCSSKYGTSWWREQWDLSQSQRILGGCRANGHALSPAALGAQTGAKHAAIFWCDIDNFPMTGAWLQCYSSELRISYLVHIHLQGSTGVLLQYTAGSNATVASLQEQIDALRNAQELQASW